MYMEILTVAFMLLFNIHLHLYSKSCIFALISSIALRVMCDEMFLIEHGDRLKAPNIGIVMTDGESSENSSQTIPTANAVRDSKDISIFAIGVGDKVSLLLLHNFIYHLCFM